MKTTQGIVSCKLSEPNSSTSVIPMQLEVESSHKMIDKKDTIMKSYGDIQGTRWA